MRNCFVEIYGIDVSEIQGNICWKDVKQDGVQFAMIRAGYGEGDIDQQFRKNAEGCTREGIPFGVFWSSYAYTFQMARQEAKFCIETVEEYKLSYPVSIVLDEDSVKYAASKGIIITKNLATELVESFCSQVKKMGYSPMFYSSKEFFEYIDVYRLCKKYPVWYAQYEGEPCLYKPLFWQYTNKRKARGITGYVNGNKAI